MAQFTEEEKTLRRIEKRFGKGVVEYGLIEEGDRILIGLSGGKDSLALVELLARRSRILKPRFSVIAVHVVMKNIPYQSDVDYLRNYTESCGIPFVLYETEFDASTDTRKSPCFLCSWNRRKALFTVAKSMNLCRMTVPGEFLSAVIWERTSSLFSFGSTAVSMTREFFSVSPSFYRLSSGWTAFSGPSRRRTC